MSLRQPRDGRPTGVKGTISAQGLRDALGLGSAPREGVVPDSPRQARLRAAGKDAEADALARDDFAVTILDPSEHYEAWGSPELAAPPGAKDGDPVPLPPPKSDAARQARRRPEDGAAINGPSPEESAAEVIKEAAKQAEEIRSYARADAERARLRAVAAMGYGSPEERANAADDANATVAFVRKVKDRIGL